MTIAVPADTPVPGAQLPLLLAHAAGYVGHRTIAIGLRSGLIETLAEHPAGLHAEALADRLSLDPFYVAVWCRSAVATGIATREDDRFRLVPHLDTLLLATDSPLYVGALFLAFEQPEVFDRFERSLATGERLWWDQCSPEWIASVEATATPFNVRLVPGGLHQVPGLVERLRRGGHVVDTACGAGAGVVRLAEHFDACRVTGIDGDAHSIHVADRRVERAGLHQRVALRTCALEQMRIDPPAVLVVNNVSMHECRDIDEVTRRVWDGLEPGGWFVISDFPFPDDDAGLATVPGRVMTGIQFFEAQIGDQLLPRAAYDELLRRHGFTDIGHVLLTPVHAVTWGRRPHTNRGEASTNP